MIVLDTSALMAVFLDEPEKDAVEARLEEATTVLVSASTVVEMHVTIRRRLGPPDLRLLTRFLDLPGIEIVPVDAALTHIALDADRRYGRGADPRAKLNFGDLFPYALATQRGLPLLFKGNDFAATDVTPAL